MGHAKSTDGKLSVDSPVSPVDFIEPLELSIRAASNGRHSEA